MQIVWSPVAEQNYLQILEYILERWSIKEAENFDKKLDSLLENLTQHKELCPPSKQAKLRRCVITPQTSLVYRIRRKTIEIVAVFDNRSAHNY